MQDKMRAAILLLAIILPTIIAQDCKPGDNCKLPDCRCWDDRKAPGGFDTKDLPQIVVVSFEYGINSGNVDSYTNLLKGLKTPNNCPVQASFYPTKIYTDPKVTTKLYKAGHEIGVSTISSASPQGEEQWSGNFSTVKKILTGAGIPNKDILGSRGPELLFAGDDQIKSARNVGLKYDTSCSTTKFDSGNFIWPFTYDFIKGVPECTQGKRVTKSYPGTWQFMVADLQFKGHRCATPSSCSQYVKTAKDASDLFYNAFSQHYNQPTRPPFMMVIDPLWLTNTEQAEGTRQFLELIAAAFKDVFIVSASQALEWVQNPVSLADTKKFEPWTC